MSDQDSAPQTAEDLRTTILARYDSFSGRLQQVARHVLDHPDDLALETLTVIADRANVQPSAIVRFAKSLGFPGASPMQRLLRDGLLAKHATLGYGERVRRFNASVNRTVDGEAGGPPPAGGRGGDIGGSRPRPTNKPGATHRRHQAHKQHQHLFLMSCCA